MTPTLHASRLRPVTGQSRTNPESGVRGSFRTVAKTLAVATAGTLIATLAPGAANAYLAPNETTDWIVVEDATGDERVAPPKFNKKGKQINRAAWDASVADLDEVQYSWDPAVQAGQDDLHIFVMSAADPTPNSSWSGGRRGDMAWTTRVWVDGALLVTLPDWLIAPTGEVTPQWATAEAAAHAAAAKADCNGLRLGDTNAGSRWFAMPAECFPSGAKHITRISFTSQMVDVNAKNKAKTAVEDTAEIVANIPVRQ